ncbi:hypothetical protein DMA11_13065 [Marinilabiliaceae bacterium JC017]|nr:hypothetical protein DMA11_13065 [Marinilabiliaceae bacterium JC017]
MDKTHLSETDKIFFKDGYNLATQGTDSALSKKQLLEVIRQQYDAMNELINAISTQAAKQQVPIDCKLGCQWCCHQPIYGISHEFLYLWEYISTKLSDDLRQKVLQKAFDNYQKRGRLQQNELLNSKAPCPLLQDGACMAYEARPMACRIYMSMSVDSCKTFFEKPDDETNYPALLEFPLQAGRMMNEGFNKGLKAAGLNGRELLMEEGLLIAHNNGETLAGDSLLEHPLFNIQNDSQQTE